MRPVANRLGPPVVVLLVLTSFQARAAEPETAGASAPTGDEKSVPVARLPVQPVEVKTTPPVALHGGVYLWYYQPLEGDAKADVSVYFANLVLESVIGHFGVHVEPRLRDTKLRPFFASNVWLQEAYGFYRQDLATVKVGKVYNRFGKIWDNSFYGNLLYFDGLKLAPDEGISVEGALAPTDARPFGFSYAAQFFVADGRTNGSLQGRDT